MSKKRVLSSFTALINLTLVLSFKANDENFGADIAEKVEDVPQMVCTKMYAGLEIKKIIEGGCTLATRGEILVAKGKNFATNMNI